MSAKAFVIVKVEPEATRKVVEQLKKLSGAVVYEVAHMTLSETSKRTPRKILPQSCETACAPRSELPIW